MENIIKTSSIEEVRERLVKINCIQTRKADKKIEKYQEDMSRKKYKP